MADRPSIEFYDMLPVYQVTYFGLFALFVTTIVKIYEWRNKNGRKNISEKKPR